jgi:H+-transporting ATPase
LAAIVAIVVSNGGGQATNWEVFVGILLLLFINSIIGFIAWRNSKNLMKTPRESCEMKVNVKRDGKWTSIKESNLVQGDFISIKQNNYFPADARIIGKFDEKFNIRKISMPIRKNYDHLSEFLRRVFTYLVDHHIFLVK